MFHWLKMFLYHIVYNYAIANVYSYVSTYVSYLVTSGSLDSRLEYMYISDDNRMESRDLILSLYLLVLHYRKKTNKSDFILNFY